MLEFNIKLRNDAKKLSLSNLKSNSLKLKLKVKGLYKNHKFRAEIYLIIKLENNKLKIVDISIYDFNIVECSSSSLDVFDNIYTIKLFDSIDNKNINKKVYNHLKTFINNIKITSDKNLINSFVFDSTNSKIRKINIKGYVRNY
jgi:hypothetical protein